MSLLVALNVMFAVAPLSRICGLLTSSFSSAMSCTISSPLTIVMRTVSPVRAHSVGIADAVDLAADAAIAEHRRLERVFAVGSGTALGRQITAGGEQECAQAELDQGRQEIHWVIFHDSAGLYALRMGRFKNRPRHFLVL